jgi:short-subunit dehydrogenase
MKTYDIAGKAVLITGASSGIGKALSSCFAEEGARLFLGCHPSEKAALESWMKELRAHFGVLARGFPIDLAADGAPERLYRAVVKNSGRLDVLVNNAGVMAYGNFHELDLERQRRILRVNAEAYLELMHLALRDMTAAGAGRVLNVGSVSAFQPSAHHAVYGATKAFVQGLSEAVNQELRGTGVTVCTLCPSYTDTPLLKGEGFPKRLLWYSVSGLADPETIARKGVRAFKRGKPVYIPGLRNWFIHAVLQRFVPRRLAGALSRRVLK